METKTHKLNLAYYNASDGPRIMLFGPMEADFQSLQTLFRSLSQSKATIQLHCLPFIQAFDHIRLHLDCSGPIFQSGQGKPQGVRRIGSSEGEEFAWRRTDEGWDYLAELIDGLVRSSGPGHQYLSSYPNEDAIVVLSKGEYGDDVLKQTTQT